MSEELGVRVKVVYSTSIKDANSSLNKVKDHFDKQPLKLKSELDVLAFQRSVSKCIRNINKSSLQIPKIKIDTMIDTTKLSTQLKKALEAVQISEGTWNGNSSFANKGTGIITSSQFAKLKSDLGSLGNAIPASLQKSFSDVSASVDMFGRSTNKTVEEYAQLKMDVASVVANIKAANAEQQKLANETQKTANAQNLVDKNIDANQIAASKYLNDVQKRWRTNQPVMSQLGSGIDNYQQQVANLKSVSDAYRNGTATVEQYNNALKAQRLAKQDLSALESGLTKFKTGTLEYQANTRALNDLNSQITDYIKNNKNLSKNDGLYRDLGELQSTLSNTNTDSAEARTNFSRLRYEFKQLGLESESLGQHLKKLFTEHMSTAFAMAGIHLLQQSLRAVYQNVKDIDLAMTELKKVTNESGATYNKFLDNAAKRAKALGTDIDDYTQAVAEWARLGYSFADSQDLANTAVMFKNVGDGIATASDAASYLISTLQGFNLTADDSQHILDAINKVSNEYAVSAQDLGEILKRSSAAMSSANNTIDQTIALGTAMNTTLQDADKTGTVLKTVSMYLRATKTELEDAGESTEGMAESTSKLREQLLALSHGKVDVLSDADTYKSTYQIFKDMAGAWKDMTDMERASALELMGGKRNANAVAAAIQNMAVAENALGAAGDSANSAMHENQTYLDSIAGKLSILNASFQSLSESLLNSGLVKFFLDFANSIVSGADAVVKITGVLPPLIGILSSLLTLSGKNAGKVNMPSILKVA